MTPFDVLGLPDDATESEVRAAHRLLAADAHARLGPHASGARMAELNVARDSAVMAARLAPCRDCSGTGRVGGFVCGACGGMRKVHVV